MHARTYAAASVALAFDEVLLDDDVHQEAKARHDRLLEDLTRMRGARSVEFPVLAFMTATAVMRLLLVYTTPCRICNMRSE